jgi:hypothetical protein
MGSGSYYYTPNGNNHYLVATIKIENNAPTPITTNPFSWNFISNAITYTYSSTTYSDIINYKSVDVGTGGTLVYQIVYEVPNTVTSGSIVATGLQSGYVKYSQNVIVPPLQTTIGTPTPTAPLNGAAIASGNIVLNWNAVDNAIYYEYDVNSDYGFGFSSFISGYITASTSDSFYSNANQIQWHVRAYTALGQIVGEWSGWNTCTLT